MEIIPDTSQKDHPCSCNSIPNYEYWKVSGGFVAGIIVCLICSNMYCYKKRKKASKDISEVQREVQYDEIGSMNCNIVNIGTLRDDTRDRMTVMHLSGINIDTLSSKSPTLSYSSTNDSLSRKTEGSENTYESINLDQNHEFKKCEASTTTLTSLYENTVVFPLRSEKIKGDVNDKTPWLFIYNRMAHVEHSL
ncbi:Hypothetical predicted protein [Mytilus galloprovincialis]|uniref:Uncharacterized protein n=1 Tax=Mytilus galloprovincialis TaxID=29158 RepID=A0A8B6DSM9_MYTGA|nr:Hypothetical predicted protein [Mytilus galloprovincialis]